MTSTFSPSVIIVGAGAAGIAAASKLISNRVYNVMVLEAENRIGGRVFTHEFGEGTVELGAQWVHGEVDNVVFALGNTAGLLSDNSYGIEHSKYIISDGTIMDDEIAGKLYIALNEIVHDGPKLNNFRSLGDCICESVKEKIEDKGIKVDTDSLESFMGWFNKLQSSINGSDSCFEPSAQTLNSYKECEGNLLTRWKKGGYQNILHLLMGNNSNRLQKKIILNKSVQKILWNQQPIEILCSDGQKFFADHVILTVSLGVLKENLLKMFEPALPPKKANAIQGLAIGTVDKIFIKFPHRWWPIDCVGFSLLWKKGDGTPDIKEDWTRGVFGFYSVDDNPCVLCGWVIGPAARYMEQCTDQQVKDTCYQLLCRFLKDTYKIPPPDSVLRSQWHLNTHFRGSYSFRSVNTDESGVKAADLAEPIIQSGKPILLFGGEATHDHYYSTVHGAIESGWREADRLLGYFSSSSLSTRYHINDMGLVETYSVIIVGAGMAGLGAAKTLFNAGIDNFLILEAQDKAGGRVCSVPFDDTGQNYIELGAQWIHGENNPVFKLAKEEDLLSNIFSDEGQGLYLKPDGEEIPLSLVHEVAGVVGDILEDCCLFIDKVDFPDSLGEYLTTKFYEYLESCDDPPDIRKKKLDLFDWHKRFQIIDNSCDELNCLSAKAWGVYQYCEGRDYNNLKQGYSSVIENLLHSLPPKCLKTCCEVKLIQYFDQKSVKVLCADGNEYQADHVIVTSSLGFLKEHHLSLFDPPLPSDISEAINNMGFDTINKLFLVYESEWWSADLRGIQLIWDSEDLDHQNWLRYVSGFDVLANLHGVLLGWVGGKGAVTMETLSDQDISLQCTQELRKFMSKPDIPLPDRIFRSKWYSNKFVCGGYSHITSKCDNKEYGPDTLAHPIYISKYNSSKHPAVLLAGEAVHRHHFSTTHGAYMSGAEQSQLIIDYYYSSQTSN